MKGPLIFCLISFCIPSLRQQSFAQVEIAEISCANCHRDKVLDFSNSKHQQAGLLCNHCHGGDIRDTDKAMSTVEGFRPIPRRDSLYLLCATCHPDVVDESHRYVGRHQILTGSSTPEIDFCNGCHHTHSQALKVHGKATGENARSKEAYINRGVASVLVLLVLAGLGLTLYQVQPRPPLRRNKD